MHLDERTAPWYHEQNRRKKEKTVWQVDATFLYCSVKVGSNYILRRRRHGLVNRVARELRRAPAQNRSARGRYVPLNLQKLWSWT